MTKKQRQHQIKRLERLNITMQAQMAIKYDEMKALHYTIEDNKKKIEDLCNDLT